MAQWDIFLSHASEDKADVATPLAEKLRALGLTVWLDDDALDLGDPLSQTIDEALANSAFGVVILSPHYFEKSWTRKELAALVSLEKVGRKVVLPVLHNITPAEVSSRSPLLAASKSARTVSGLEIVAQQILRAVRSASGREVVGSESAVHKPSQVFDVRVQPQRARELTAYERALQTSGVVKVDGRQGSGSLKRVLDLGGGQELTLLWVEPGEFLMGSPTTEVGRDKDEPLHRVILTRDFFLGETEVTQAQWKAVMGTEPWKGQEYVKEGANLAASYISYDEALEFCKRLNWSQQAGQRPPVGWIFGLPSEAQWEYACRAGTTTAYCSGDSELDLARVAVYYGNKDGDYAHPVRTKAPNDWGFFDMHGNVWEWTADAGSDGKSFVDGEKDPLVEGPSSAPRVVRGGSWYDNRSRCRSAYRFWSDPRNRSWIRGFRLCLLPGPGAPPEAK